MGNRFRWFGFGGLCLISGTTWLAGPALRSTWPPLFKLCFHNAAVFLSLLVWVVKSGYAAREWMRWEAMVWGAVLFALPQALFSAATGGVRSTTELLTLALIPAFTIFFLAVRSGSELGGLLPALVGAGGLALVVPVALPVSEGGYVWLAATVGAAAMVALAGIRLHHVLEANSILSVATSVTAAAATVSLLGWLVLERTVLAFSWRVAAEETAWGLGVDLPLVLLTVWLLRILSPIKFSTRFLLVPLVTLVGGLLLIRPAVPWTTWLGLALVAGTSWMLVREPDAEEPSGFGRPIPSGGEE